MSPDTTQPSGNKERPADHGEPFSDASSSYWPEGWNWARFSNPEADFTDLSEDERMKMLEGLEEVLGEDGMDKMRIYTERKSRKWHDKQLRDKGVPPPEYRAPGFLSESRERCLNGRPWGFIAFRTVLYDDEARWAEFKDRLQQILNLAFERVVDSHGGHEYEEVTRGRELFTLYWVEDEELLNGATEERLREQYEKVKKEAPNGMDYRLFLSTCPEVVDSVFSDPLPTTDSFFWRDDAPFLLVVMEATEENPHGDEPHDPDDPHDERNWYKSVFKVPVEIVPDVFWEVVELGITPPTRLTRKVKACNQLLGGPVPRAILIDDLRELWWGLFPSPQDRRRKARLRGFN
ncbi:hypothetical protein MGYG_06243 [Nannizzia gypsea CBS 118893]|uniref:Uncharacterized protein n=1 Tax=Arthroderma gypseum (strain ATCC MYA-4604 / CBS 118893) TaxID=535722 RepID=E4UYR1_ARTGP|nr:hypothetical protein MGYG_06243 [Nannizzia gypsea CBS 118893]EFR03241.1 hypothetical protein MGYG_06243 [Nannizzia gypsea CBS 118893]